MLSGERGQPWEPQGQTLGGGEVRSQEMQLAWNPDGGNW